ncbi:MAG: GNAT family N-acetyltransferase [Chloroflexi bacterium AL-W]|nr:GNAT family N-acetyltransferase [Chloroflexi bacterium AL-N1]NOK67857.1 GNAT family N-acetyltransferase [Chloroflexi bacterium AL-N10]NOK75374.1 GNAT family N-acetyltransferase [Chloroflexi bacterium AL-N5]NOK82162.1 GNAT family N-acetyltransferase [Chloroflexi bacterium AL-W]NOK90007.1 GNAT family N-acetyltransferase [Chloroflexi bacterium AL-N15]
MPVPCIIDQLEAAAFNAWPAFQQILVDGWLVRFANGYTKRANSVNRLYPSVSPNDELIAWCEQLFQAQGLPPVFRIVGRPETQLLDTLLDQRGYRLLDRSVVMSCKESALNLLPTSQEELTRLSLDTWFPLFCRLSHSPEHTQSTHQRILEQIMPPCLFAAIFDDGQPVACGMCVLDRTLCGFFDIITHADHRGRGYGTRLMGAMAEWSRGHGAQIFYLQVAEQNMPARRLYHKLGFRDTYHYWYRIKPDAMKRYRSEELKAESRKYN